MSRPELKIQYRFGASSAFLSAMAILQGMVYSKVEHSDPQIKVSVLKIRIHTSTTQSEREVTHLLAFLQKYGFAPDGARCHWVGERPLTPPQHAMFTWGTGSDENPDLEIGFLTSDRPRNEALLNRLRQPVLLIGPHGVPKAIEHVCVPFEGKQFNAKWLRTVLETAAAKRWNIRLLHTEHGVVAHEIMRLAEWFKLESVSEALKTWMTEDLKNAFHDFIDRYPRTEVKAGVGRWREIFEDEDPSRTLIMGSLKSGYHLLPWRHGLNYAAVLTRTETSGFFIPSE